MENMELKKQMGESCIICDNIKVEGIHLYESFICQECEKNIINTNTSDPKYQYYLKKLRNITSQKIYTS